MSLEELISAIHDGISIAKSIASVMSMRLWNSNLAGWAVAERMLGMEIKVLLSAKTNNEINRSAERKNISIMFFPHGIFLTYYCSIASFWTNKKIMPLLSMQKAHKFNNSLAELSSCKPLGKLPKKKNNSLAKDSNKRNKSSLNNCRNFPNLKIII